MPGIPSAGRMAVQVLVEALSGSTKGSDANVFTMRYTL